MTISIFKLFSASVYRYPLSGAITRREGTNPGEIGPLFPSTFERNIRYGEKNDVTYCRNVGRQTYEIVTRQDTYLFSSLAPYAYGNCVKRIIVIFARPTVSRGYVGEKINRPRSAPDGPRQLFRRGSLISRRVDPLVFARYSLPVIRLVNRFSARPIRSG